MVSKTLSLIVAAIVGWWAWTGPIHDWQTVTDKERTDANAKDMALCLSGKQNYYNATGNMVADPEAACARQLNLYRHEGQWYSYSQPRKASNNGS